jgi:hypothetical protein
MEGVKVTAFQLGHFLAEMDRAAILRPLQLSK